MTLESLDVSHPTLGGENALEIWEKVIRKVRVGMMPPQGAKQPSAEERGNLVICRWKTSTQFGAWRDREAGSASALIDSSGTLLDGTAVRGPVELRKALLKKPEIFVGTLTEKLFIYALGRGLSAHDMPEIRAIVRATASQDYRLSQLSPGVVQSKPFQMRAGASVRT